MNAPLSKYVFSSFQAYLVTLALALMPGLYERGLLQKYWTQLTMKITDLYKGKVGHLKKAE